MNRIRRLVSGCLTAWLWLASSGYSFSQSRPAADSVDAFLRRQMRERRITGLQLAVVQRGKIALLRSYGLANVQDSLPVTNRSVFPVYSCTKSVTGVAIMQLVEEGKIDLAAPVARYLDGLPAPWQPVTIRQLLTHVSGLPDINRLLNPNTFGLDALGSEEAAWAKIQAQPMDFAPGEQFAYNQTNYVLLGKLIDKLAGKPFAEVFQQQFAVAGMPSTVLGDSRDVVPRRVQSYRYVTRLDGKTLGAEKLVNVYGEHPPFRRTASGLNSTAEELARWVIALQHGQLLKTKAALRTLWTAGRYNNGTPTQWALGWVTKPRPSHSAVTITGGSVAAMYVYPEDDLSLIVLTNQAGTYPEEFLDELAGYYNPKIPLADPLTALRMQLQRRGYAQALAEELKSKPKSQWPTENDLNDWAYRLMNGRGRVKEGLEVFRLTASLYPGSWNAYDSLGEALLKNGRKEDAIGMYRKSIELNPNNQHGKKVLEQLTK
ncbi:serine hydrolase [Hymenobacter sp. 15J16-1T3B]|uniref:serine hydrolase n=1 Tax=Hymenobacter sp. 15J16-1T3B TaxID=2886941 RepID=UPI001D12C308|nr:serine hydrolase [Hymenobacter sp. 15J16-1T3B]MCC3156811.1 serine hydrolase [Hymenobacter sp. 15J16-1T3B]